MSFHVLKGDFDEDDQSERGWFQHMLCPSSRTFGSKDTVHRVSSSEIHQKLEHLFGGDRQNQWLRASSDIQVSDEPSCKNARNVERVDPLRVRVDRDHNTILFRCQDAMDLRRTVVLVKAVLESHGLGDVVSLGTR